MNQWKQYYLYIIIYVEDKQFSVSGCNWKCYKPTSWPECYWLSFIVSLLYGSYSKINMFLESAKSKNSENFDLIGQNGYSIGYVGPLKWWNQLEYPIQQNLCSPVIIYDFITVQRKWYCFKGNWFLSRYNSIITNPSWSNIF